MQRSLDTEEVDPYADVYAGDAECSPSSTLWLAANPNAFTSDW